MRKRASKELKPITGTRWANGFRTFPPAKYKGIILCKSLPGFRLFISRFRPFQTKVFEVLKRAKP